MLVGLLLFVLIDSLVGNGASGVLQSFLEWIRLRHWSVAALAFAAAYALCTLLALPGSILTLGAGFIFTKALSSAEGIAVASASVFVGASIGAYGCFLLSRLILRDWASGFFQQYTILRAVDRAIAKYPLRVMVLLRLSPVVPFNVLNYASGTLPISHMSYLLAMLGMIPGTVVYCVVGSYLSSLSDLAGGGSGGMSGGGEHKDSKRAKVLKQVLWAVGVVATVICLVLITWYARQELQNQLNEDEDSLGEGEIEIEIEGEERGVGGEGSSINRIAQQGEESATASERGASILYSKDGATAGHNPREATLCGSVGLEEQARLQDGGFGTLASGAEVGIRHREWSAGGTKYGRP